MRKVENTLPNPPKTSGPSKKLPEFVVFVQAITPLLTRVQRDDVISLLECLYEATKTKIEFEQYRHWARENAEAVRKARDSMAAVRRQLSKASHVIEKTAEDNHAELEQIESWVKGGEFEFTFDEITEHLKRALETTANIEVFLAGMVHPHLRKPAEKNMAKRLLNPEIDAGLVESSFESLVFPARPLSPDIDHWFIGAAADCLDKFRTGTGRNIPRYDDIISKVFEIAFGDGERDAENIRTELGRQKKEGRPIYHPPGRPIPGAIPSTPHDPDLGQKSVASPPQIRKLSGQKPKK